MIFMNACWQGRIFPNWRSTIPYLQTGLGGGDLGYFARGSLPKEFDEACFNLKKGEISPVVKSDYGYHIFKLLDRKPAGKKALAEVAPQIQQLLFEEKLKKKYDTWIKKVQASVTVIFHKDILDNITL